MIVAHRIQDAVEDISILDLIEDEEQVITMSVRGYIKRMSNDEFQEQRRGGKGKRGVKSKKEDAAKDIFMATNTKSDLLVFTTRGIMYKLPVYKIPKRREMHPEHQSSIYCRLTKMIRLRRFCECSHLMMSHWIWSSVRPKGW